MKKTILTFVASVVLISAGVVLLITKFCTENYSEGERIGFVTQFSKTGLIYKTWEGHLNLTQTGMNSSQPFDFSIDRDKSEPFVISTIDSAAQFGWKIKLRYHQTFGLNWFHNRGETNYFITKCEVLDRNPMGSLFNKETNVHQSDKVHDTIYLVIDKSKN